MSTHRIWIPALLAAAASLLPAQEKPATSAPAVDASIKKAPGTPIIGVVDLAKAFEQYPKAIKKNEELEKMRVAFDERVKQATKQLDELRENIKLLAEGSEERRQKEFEFESGMQQRKFVAGMLTDRLHLADYRNQIAIYEDMEIAINKVAKNRGVQIVMRTFNPGPPLTPVDKAPPQEVLDRLRRFENRQVWFATDEIDLTGDVIKLLQVPLENDTAPALPPAPAAKQDAAKVPPSKDRGNK